MNGTRHTLCAAIVIIVFAGLAPQAFGLEASATFEETVPPSGELTKTGKDVVNLVGIQTYKLKAPAGKVIDEKSVVWSGAPGAASNNGKLTATFVQFDSDNPQYTVTAKGHFLDTEGQAGEGFKLHFKGAVYKPLLTITDPTADKGSPAGAQNTIQFCAQMKAQYTGKQDETAWAEGLVYDVQITDAGGADADPAKAYFTDYEGSSMNCGTLDANGKVQENWVITQAALPGEVYHVKVVISAQTDFSANSNKVTVFGLTFDSASPPTIPLLPGGGEMATDVTFGYTIVPNDYQPTSQKIRIMQGDEKKNEVPGQNGTATWTKMAFPAGAYNAEAVVNEGIAGEESVAEQSFGLLIFGMKLLDPAAAQSSTVTSGDKVDCAAELMPAGLAPDDPAANKWYLDGDNLGAFEDESALVTKLDTSDPGQAEIYAKVTKNGVTAESERHTLNVKGVDGVKIYATGSWRDAPDTLVVLKGTKYTFKAVLKGGSSWPDGQPEWSGIKSGTGETIEVTFNSAGDGKKLKASCGASSHEFTIDVIVPSIERMDLSGSGTNGHDMEGAEEYWAAAGGGGNVGCFTQGTKTKVKVKLTHPTKTLTYSTDVEIWGDVNWFDDDMSGGNYDVTAITIGATWNTTYSVQSERNAEGQVDYDTDVDMQWQYRVPSGTNSWKCLGNVNNLKYYLVWNTPSAPQATPWYGVVQRAVVWANDKNSATEAADAIMKNIYGACGGAYDTVWGVPAYTSGGTTESFNLRLFLSHISSIGAVNCYDCGKALTVFGNAIGCGMTYKFAIPFGYLNCIKPIGKGWTNNPFYDNPTNSSDPIVGEDDDASSGRSGFGNHAFSSIGSNIYDSCLKVDTDSNPDAPPHSESWMSGEPWASYKSKVVDNVPAVATGSPTRYAFGVY